MNVRIVQCLCPNRHCITAIAYETATGEPDDGYTEALHSRMLRMVEKRWLNPWCELCKAPFNSWQYEDGATAFGTLAEAKPALHQLQAEQLNAQAAIVRRTSNN